MLGKADRGCRARIARAGIGGAKLVETLEPVAGAGNVRASVNVDYDPIGR